MRRFLLVLLGLAGCAPGKADDLGSAREPRAPVVLVSLDGFRWDYLDRGLTPTLSRLAREGVRARALVPVFPTRTFPNHYSIATGLHPGRHGMIGNEFRAPDLGASFSMRDRASVRDPRFWGGEPIWVTAERQGVRTAPLFWPGSEAPIGGVRPSLFLPFDDRMPDTARVRQVLDWLDLPASRRPRFLTLYLSLVDNAGHEHGPEAPQTDSAIAWADRVVGSLAQGLRARTGSGVANLIVVSDHGMASTGPDRVIWLDDYLSRDALEVDARSPVLMAWPRRGLGDSVYRGLRRAGHLAVYRRDELPDRLHLQGSPRAPPIVALADEGWSLAWRPRPGDPPFRIGNGDHGYDPAFRSMHGVFVGHGPAFRRGLVVPQFGNIHLYPLLAALLGIAPAQTEGSLDSVQAMLSRSAVPGCSLERPSQDRSPCR